MKRILFTLLFFLTISVSAQEFDKGKEYFDSLSEDDKELTTSLVEDIIFNLIDSVMEEGMYMKALDLLDSVNANWQKTFGVEVPYQMYLKKGEVYMRLEEWQRLVDVTTECINKKNGTLPNQVVPIMYNMQGMGYSNLEKYKDAIRSYENALSYYSKNEDLGSQGDVLCNIGHCYNKSRKLLSASSFYNKGLLKFLEYFKITKKQLLQRELKVYDAYEKTLLNSFAVHLFNMAVYEQDYGDKSTSKEYLLMSAHCGYNLAKSEYQRIYGHY